ncbi:MAG: hypothetical protein L0387_25560 [Acidobacteria bacterium]|nr:hypothetical protein [Acidobacteriota bacterium]MCI0722771.1 hypothetical protein [Acidobacteriota bacterium]
MNTRKQSLVALLQCPPLAERLVPAPVLAGPGLIQPNKPHVLRWALLAAFLAIVFAAPARASHPVPGDIILQCGLLAISGSSSMMMDACSTVAADACGENPLLPGSDTKETKAARHRLQRVLDSMKPFRQFNPEEVPTKDLRGEASAGYVFQDLQGYVVMEAETVPVPREESWQVESVIPGYAGTGYLRCLRDNRQATSPGRVGLPVRLATSGKWRLLVRCRTDHPVDGVEN